MFDRDLKKWKKFLFESTQKKIPSGGAPAMPYAPENASFGELSLYVKEDGESVLFVLYYPVNIKKSLNLKTTTQAQKFYYIVGSSELYETEEPCIPITMEQGQIYTEPATWGSKNKYGKTLSLIGFYYAKSKGYGMTSDHATGTRPKATGVWDKIKSLSDLKGGSMYTAKVTDLNNNKFDYHDNTPDPDDDCDYPGPGETASDHSFVLNDTTKAKEDYDKYTKQHMKNKKLLGTKNSSVFEKSMRLKQAARFNTVYNAKLNQ